MEVGLAEPLGGIKMHIDAVTKTAKCTQVYENM
jgi:hypothetical protein